MLLQVPFPVRQEETEEIVRNRQVLEFNVSDTLENVFLEIVLQIAS